MQTLLKKKKIILLFLISFFSSCSVIEGISQSWNGRWNIYSYCRNRSNNSDYQQRKIKNRNYEK
jgi:hypothetical protein